MGDCGSSQLIQKIHDRDTYLLAVPVKVQPMREQLQCTSLSPQQKENVLYYSVIKAVTALYRKSCWLNIELSLHPSIVTHMTHVTWTHDSSSIPSRVLHVHVDKTIVHNAKLQSS